MTVLTALQAACTRGIALTKPNAVFGQSTRELVELAALAQQAADMIAVSHEWQKFLKLATVTGDGSTTDFDLPDDFKRLPLDTKMISTANQAPLLHVSDRNEWLGMIIRGDQLIVPAWIIYSDQVHFNPALSSTDTAKYWYQTDQIVKAADNSLKAAFTIDTDTFRLDEELLTLCVVWLWRALKGLAYAEEMATYERRLSKFIAADGGQEVISVGSNPFPRMGTAAYPFTIADS